MKRGERIPLHDHDPAHLNSGGPVKASGIVKAAGGGGGPGGSTPNLAAVLSAGNRTEGTSILGGHTQAVTIRAGDGDTGDALLFLGSGGGDEGVGGQVSLIGGTGDAGDDGGPVTLAAGGGDADAAAGAAIVLGPGSGDGVTDGDATVTARYVILVGLPGSDPGVPGALWVDGSNFLKVSP